MNASKPSSSSKPATPAKTQEGERLAKYLARAGIASRREVERMVIAGRIKVDGKKLDSPALNVTGDETILVDGKPVSGPEPTRLWRYHKPQGLLTSHKDTHGRPTVFENLPPDIPRVVSVGRLDLNSEGLLLLTNDGALAGLLENPKTAWVRRYRVRIHGRPSDNELASLADGVTVEGIRYGAISARLERQQGANAWLSVSLSEGKNREIRRVMEHMGWRVSRLIRIAYGPFQLGHLAPGICEEVRGKHLNEQLGRLLPNIVTTADRDRQQRKARNATNKPGSKDNRPKGNKPSRPREG